MSQKRLTEAEMEATMFLATAEEATKICKYATWMHAVRARNIITTFMGGPDKECYFSNGICFFAGIVEGVRRERKRRKDRLHSENKLIRYRGYIYELTMHIKSEKNMHCVILLLPGGSRQGLTFAVSPIS